MVPIDYMLTSNNEIVDGVIEGYVPWGRIPGSEFDKMPEIYRLPIQDNVENGDHRQYAPSPLPSRGFGQEIPPKKQEPDSERGHVIIDYSI